MVKITVMSDAIIQWVAQSSVWRQYLASSPITAYDM